MIPFYSVVSMYLSFSVKGVMSCLESCLPWIIKKIYPIHTSVNYDFVHLTFSFYLTLKFYHDLCSLHLAHSSEAHFCLCSSWKFYKFWPDRVQNCFWVSAMKCLITLSFFWKYCVNKFWQCAKHSEKTNLCFPHILSPSGKKRKCEKETKIPQLGQISHSCRKTLAPNLSF